MSDAQRELAQRELAQREQAQKAMEESKAATKANFEKVDAARRELMATSEKVMATSKPTPTQAENDAAALGLLPEGPAHVEQPLMPPVHEQLTTLEAAAEARPGTRPPGNQPPAQRGAPPPQPRAPAPAPTHPPEPHRT